MNTNVKNISEIVDDIKEKLTDYQYKTIMDNLMALNNKKEEVEAEVEEETDEELEELSEQISFLNIYIPTIDDDELKKIFVRRLDTLQFMFSERC
jgi:transglutaminase/protease-like cytokinesis protein 3